MKSKTLQFFFLLTCVFACSSCSFLNTESETSVVPNPVWPEPPETPRYQFEASIYSNDDIEETSRAQSLEFVLTGAKNTRYPMSAPVDVAARGGLIYITDWRLKVVHVFNIRLRKYYTFGQRQKGKLARPQAICMDGRGLIYVTDVKSKVVHVYDGLGMYRGEMGKGLLERPVGITANADGSRIFVVDNGGVESTKHEILVFDENFELLHKIGSRGTEEGKFNLPIDAVWTPDKKLYVLDAGNFRVQVFNEEGKFLSKWGSVGDQFGNFGKPRSIAADTDGNIYVSDSKLGNVQIFDPLGTLLLNIGKFDLKDGKGAYALLSGIAIDETNRLYLTDQFFKKLEVIRRLPIPIPSTDDLN